MVREHFIKWHAKSFQAVNTGMTVNKIAKVANIPYITALRSLVPEANAEGLIDIEVIIAPLKNSEGTKVMRRIITLTDRGIAFKEKYKEMLSL